MSTLSNTVRRLLARSKDTHYELARRSGVSAPQLSRFSRRERGLKAEALEALADALGYRITVVPKRKGRRK